MSEGALVYTFVYNYFMEKIPGFRVVGDARDEIKQQEKEKIENKLINHIGSLSESDKKQMDRYEYPKSQTEIAVLDFVNQETNRLREECGAESYDIPIENYHIIPDDVYKKINGESSDAVCFNERQGVMFKASEFRSNPVNFGSVALHETLHLKGHFTIEVEEDGNGEVETTPFREGVSARAAQKKGLNGEYHEHFKGLHEAIVSEQQKRSTPNLLNIPELADEKERLNSPEAILLKEKISKKRNIDIGDVVWVGDNEKEYETINYEKQRKVLRYICDQIQQDFKDKYNSTDDVFKEFLSAQFTGRLLPIARLVESSFGEGSFRLLGDMGSDRFSPVLSLENLKKTRSRFLKNKKLE